MSRPNHIKNIIISGAGGTMGTHIVHQLLAQGLHRVSALTRPSSTSPLPPGLHAVRTADPGSHASLVSALRGEDVLILMLASAVPAAAQRPLILAAAEAGVRYVVPNEYGLDYGHAGLARDTGLGGGAVEVRRYVEEVGGGGMRWIALTCSFWYGFSLAGGEVRFGFDFARRRLTLFDAGEVRICTSTWGQGARALAKVLALPIRGEEGYEGPTLGGWEDGAVYVTSFVVSQREMFESVLRVMGEREGDWEVRTEGSEARFERGRRMAAEGDPMGMALAAYTRTFYAGGGGDFSHKVVNEQLGLPREDLDAATREAVRLHEEGFWEKRSAGAAARTNAT